jgi:hypothetical protein
MSSYPLGAAGWGRAAALAVAVVLVAALVCPPAPAAVYTVDSCRLPDGRTIPFTGWQPGPPVLGPGLSVESDCGLEGLVASSGETDWTNEGAYAEWAFRAPPGTEIASYRLERSARGMFFDDFGGNAHALSGYRLVAQGRAGQQEEIESCPPFGGPADACDDLAPAAEGSLPDGTVELAARAGCWSVDIFEGCPGPGTDNFPDGSAWVVISAARLGLEDASAPRLLGPPSGGLLSAAAPFGGSAEARVAATDSGGGLRSVTVELDGKPLRSFALCQPPFTQPVPCPLAIDRAFRVDLAGVPAGSHRVRVLVADATGANVTASDSYPITVMGALVGPGALLTARVVTARGRRVDGRRPRAVAYRSRTRLVGVLRTSEGRRIAGATLSVWERLATPGRRWRVVGTVTTDARGGYARRLAHGPSRELRVSYRPLAQQVADSARVQTRLVVRAPVKLSVSHADLPEGATIRFAGALPGGPRPARGKLVLLQVRDRGTWRTFANVRADRKRGRFGYRYRFPSLGSTRTHRFRARVPSDNSYPYATGDSRSITVTVRRSG